MSCAAIMNGGALSGGGPAPGAPVASFTPLSANVYAGSSVQLTDTSTGVPTSWSWTVNGAQFSTIQNPKFTPPSQGVYVIELTVSNSFGSNTTNVPGIITAHN